MSKESIERKIVANLWRRYRWARTYYKRDPTIMKEGAMYEAWNAAVSSSNLLYTGKC